jgi:N4-(beta-N-acetylglucosaminyl)-L-asparaginase
MSDRISRRDFVKAGTAASVVAAVPAAAFDEAPTVLVRRATPPVVISSGNGHEYRNGGPHTCVEEAFERIVKGEDVLDALIAGVNIVELDPTEMYVGYGGLPNADGVVQLDSCRMHGPLKGPGASPVSRGCARPRGSRRRSSRARTITSSSGRERRPSPGRWASRSRPT